jgi:catechol-2,3-dioxygenase
VIKAKRLRYVTIETRDLPRQVEYYESIIGLVTIAREKNRAFMATESGQLALIVEQSDRARCNSIALDIAPGLELSDLQHSLSKVGIQAEAWTGAIPGTASGLRFTDFEGRRLELLSGWHSYDNRQAVAGISPVKLGHLALYTKDPQAAAQYYCDRLGFRVSDWIEDRFVFMRCGFEHHILNFVRGDEAREHHVAFELRDAAHMSQVCDWLGRNRIDILWGPVRHGPGHNVAIYHRDPDDRVVEFFFDMDRMVDEELGYFDPRPWHRDRPQKPKVWVGLPRDVWGVAPSKELTEFARKAEG